MAEWIKKNKIQWYTYCLQETHFSLKHTHRWRVKGRKNISSKWWSKKCRSGDLPGGPVVKNPPSNAGDAGSIPGRGTKIPHATGQLSLRASTREPSRCNERSRMPQRTSCVPQLRPNAAKKKPPKNKNKNKNKNRTKTCGQTTMYKMDKQQAYIV